MAKSKVTDEEIREAAYHMWIADGAPHGRDQDYWLKAEAALTAPKPRKRAAPKKPPAAKPAAKAAKPRATKAKTAKPKA